VQIFISNINVLKKESDTKLCQNKYTIHFPATVDKQQKIQSLGLRDEIKFLYTKKEKLNNAVHKLHLKLPKNGESMVPIKDSIKETINKELQENIKQQKKNLRNSLTLKGMNKTV
jgi:hypothetical protein